MVQSAENRYRQCETDAPQHIELVSKDEDFDFQLSPRPEQVGQGAPG